MKNPRICFGYLCLRTAALLLAIGGGLAHVQTFRWLASLDAALPQVPHTRLHHLPTPLPVIHHLSTTVETVFHHPKPGATSVPSSAVESSAKVDLHSWHLFNVLSANQVGEHDVNDDDALREMEMWNAMRVLASLMRVYIALSILACAAGVVGILKSRLFLSRIFLVQSFLDLFFCVLSFLSLSLLCTYPSVRTHLCEQFASGEVQGWLASLRSGSHASPHGLPLERGTEEPIRSSNWHSESVLDGMLSPENCEESFGSTFVPVFILCGLMYTSMRLKFFLTINQFYKTLLWERTLMYGYLSSAPTSSNSSASSASSPSPPPMTHITMLGSKRERFGGEKRR